MRQNSQEFNVFNQSASKDLRLVIMLDFATPVYFSSHSDIPNLPVGTITNTVKNTSSISQSLNPDVARAEIGKLSFSLLDLNGAVTQAFRNANALDEGMNGLTVKLFRGGLAMDFTDFRLEQTQQIDKDVSFKDNVYSIMCTDIQRVLRKDIFDLAKTQLSKNLVAEDLTIEVRSTAKFQFCDHVASFSDKPSGQYIYLKISQGDLFEIVRASGKTGTTFTGVERGLFGTNDITHNIPNDANEDNGISVEEFVYIELPIPAMAYAILTGNIIGGGTIPSTWSLGIDPSKVDIDAFINIGEDLFDENDFTQGFVTYFSGLTKTTGKAFLEKEICFLMGAFMPVLSSGKLSLKLMSSVLSHADAIAELNEDNIVSHGNIKYDHSKIYNQLEINWAYMQFVGQSAQFYRKHTLLDSGSINKHGVGSVYKKSFKGLHSSRHTITHIHNLFDSLRDRYAGPPLFLTVTLLPSMNDLEQGDIVRVKLPEQRDFMGFDRLDRAFEIQKITVDQLTGRVVAQLFGSSEKASTIIEDNASVDAELPDSFYTQNGTSASAVLTISNSILQSNATLTGTVGRKTTQAYWDSDKSNSTTLRKIYYVDGDLIIPSGRVLTVFDNVEIRVKGHFQIDGSIIVQKTPDEVMVPGYLGFTQSQGGFDYDNDRYGESNGASIPFVSASKASVPTLNIVHDKNGLHGIPGDMCGTSGKRGRSTTGYKEFNNATGGEGGIGGGSLVIVARGVTFGVAGVIDTSGADASPGELFLPGGKYYAGSGGGGAPGSLVVLIDGINASYPSLNSSFKAKFGLSPLLGNPKGVGEAPWHSAKYPGKSATREDLGVNAAHIQYVPPSQDAYPVNEELLSTVPALSGLIYSPLADNINHGLLSWDEVDESLNAKYRVKLFDDNGAHVWVKYATDSSGSNMSDAPTGKTHIGFALNKTTTVKSLVVTDYQWFVIDSELGYEVQGSQGEPRFIWVKYSTNLLGTNPVDANAGNSYIGISINRRTNIKKTLQGWYQWFPAFGTTSLDHFNKPTLISNQLVDSNELYIAGLGAGKYRASVAIITSRNRSNYADVLVEVTQASFEALATDYDDERISNDIAAEVAQTKANLAKTQANAYADDIVTDEENRAIADATAKANAAEQAAKNYADNKFIDSVTYGTELADLQSQIDGNITTWFLNGVPTLTNAPANTWTNTALKNQHLSDIYYDDATGFAYRFKLVSNTYSWQKIDDSDITKALSDASKAQDTADSKRRVFVSQPSVPYDIGDLWDIGTGFKRCINQKLVTGTYSPVDWQSAADITNYNDSRVSNSNVDANSVGAVPVNTTLFPRYKALSAIHGNSAISTSQFITALTSAGAFSGNHNVFKASWSYSGHGYISDTGCGVIDLAGATIEVIGTSGTYMVRITSAPTASGHGGIAHTTWEYRNHGSIYNPGWRMVLNSGNFQNSITKAYIDNLGVAAATATNATNATNAENAQRWSAARTLKTTLTGDATGSAAISVDGGSNKTATINVTVKDDSHSHIIDNIDNLQMALDFKVGFADLTYDGVTTYATAIKSVQQFTDWLQSGDADLSAYDLITPSIATAFINSVIAQFNIVIAAAANIDVLDSRIIDVDTLFAKSIIADAMEAKAITADKVDIGDLFAQAITASGSITGATLIGGVIKTSLQTNVDRTIIDGDTIKYYDANKTLPALVIGTNSVGVPRGILELGYTGYNKKALKAVGATNSGYALATFEQESSGYAAEFIAKGLTYGRAVFAKSTTKQSALVVSQISSSPTEAAASFTASNGHAAAFVTALSIAPFTVNSSVMVPNLNAYKLGNYTYSQIISTARAKSQLDADKVDGYHAVKDSYSANQVVVRNSSGDIHARLLRANYTNQSTISGALAFRVNNASDNYLRYCSSTSAIRAWLDVYRKSDVYTKTEVNNSYAFKPAYTKASNGYWKCNTSGIIIQWGYSTGVANGLKTVTYPTSFPTACTSFVVTIVDTASNDWNPLHIYSKSISSARVRGTDSTAHPFNWIAIGY